MRRRLNPEERRVSWVKNTSEDRKLSQRRMAYNLLGIAIILMILILRLLKM